VTSDQVLTLPEAVHQTLAVRLGPETRRFYDELEEEMVAKLEDGGIVSVENRMVAVGRLQLAACGYTREDGSDSFRRVYGQPDKRLALREFLADFPASEPLCVFVKYRCDLDEVAEEVAASGRTSRELSGRKKQLESWQAGEASVLVVQQQAGGVGIDLTRSSYMVFYSISHSLGDYEQSLARIRRPGQAKCCRYYHFVAEGTVDEDVYAAISEKRDIVESVLNRLQRRVTA
jgi:SNF2 family DNA or RNA helicase